MVALNERLFDITGTVVRNTSGNLVITLDMQMNADVATSYVASSGTPPTVVCTAPGGGRLHIVATVTPDTPVTETATRTGRFTQIPD